MRVNHICGCGGSLAYLAAYDVHRAKAFGRTAPTTGIDPFMALVAQVMSIEPYTGAKRFFWVVDNGSSHRAKKAADRLTAAFPTSDLDDLLARRRRAISIPAGPGLWSVLPGWGGGTDAGRRRERQAAARYREPMR